MPVAATCERFSDEVPAAVAAAVVVAVGTDTEIVWRMSFFRASYLAVNGSCARCMRFFSNWVRSSIIWICRSSCCNSASRADALMSCAAAASARASASASWACRSSICRVIWPGPRCK
ncbi:hypothetical protein Vafri_8599 [Volvox africanus]|uniref:Uncharacterized protein n=1 Tax=Volvox africanus TaxID=51714 RepID=A0A8J4B2K5_9CHLO|nr:hypothetical protein Vafri_8599 [Volvox africanus]